MIHSCFVFFMFRNLVGLFPYRVVSISLSTVIVERARTMNFVVTFFFHEWACTFSHGNAWIHLPEGQ